MLQSSEYNADQRETSPFRKVTACLYRHNTSVKYYALLKKSGKQYRGALKTKDRKMADRRLSPYRDKVERLTEMRKSGVAEKTERACLRERGEDRLQAV